MIIVNKEEKDYIKCLSCYKGKNEGKKIKSISIGVNEGDLRTIKLCQECINELLIQSVEAYED